MEAADMMAAVSASAGRRSKASALQRLTRLRHQFFFIVQCALAAAAAWFRALPTAGDTAACVGTATTQASRAAPARSERLKAVAVGRMKILFQLQSGLRVGLNVVSSPDDGATRLAGG